METLIIILAGVLVTVATYLFLSRNLIRIILGSALLSHAANLLLMAMGGFRPSNVPLLGEHKSGFTDALPQALILTAIVISFGVTAIFIVLAYRTYEENGTDNLEALRGHHDE